MKMNNLYIITIFLCLCNLKCLCNKNADDEGNSTASEESKSTTGNSSGGGGTPTSADDEGTPTASEESKSTTGNSSGGGGTPTSAEDNATHFREKLKESYSKFIAEQAAKEIKAEEERQANFQKDREEWKKLCEDELASGIANRNKVKRGETRGDIKLVTLIVGRYDTDMVRMSRKDLDEFIDEIGNKKSKSFTDEQKDDIVTLLKASDNLYRELRETKENLTYLLANPDPDITCATPERLQLAEKLLADLQQQRADIAQILSEQGDDISNYAAAPEPEYQNPPAATDENNQANKDLFLKVSDPSDAKALVTAIEQQMRNMIADHAPLPSTRATFKPTTSVEEQAQALAKQASMLRSLLSSIEGMLQDAYFGEYMNDYIDRSTEEGVEKIKCIQAAIDQLEEIDELFKARFHVGGYSPDIVSPPRLTKSYINALVNALVDQMVPGSELAKGKTLPTTAESWADLALSNGLDILQKTDTNKFEDVKGIWLLIKPIGSHRYNMLKERIIEVYRQLTK